MKIARIFMDVDMRCNFEGMREVLKSAKIDLDTIKSDYVVILMNRRKTAFKMLVDNAYIVYYKNGNRRIPLEAIQYIPQRFGGSEMEFNKAVEKSLRVSLNIPDAETPVHKTKVIRRPHAEARA
jgi:hypothetical protein